jgi:hypothetical protein
VSLVGRLVPRHLCSEWEAVYIATVLDSSARLSPECPWNALAHEARRAESSTRPLG